MKSKPQQRFTQRLMTCGVILLMVAGCVVTLVRYYACAPFDNSAFYAAIENNDLAEVRRLLDKGHDPNSRMQCYLDNGGDNGATLVDRPRAETPVFVAVEKAGPEVLAALLAGGARPDEQGESGRPALMEAIDEAKYEHVALLLKHGANPNWRDARSGETPLIVAAKNNQLENVRVLLQAGAEKGIRDENGKTALDYAPDDSPVMALLRK